MSVPQLTTLPDEDPLKTPGLLPQGNLDTRGQIAVNGYAVATGEIDLAESASSSSNVSKQSTRPQRGPEAQEVLRVKIPSNAETLELDKQDGTHPTPTNPDGVSNKTQNLPTSSEGRKMGIIREESEEKDQGSLTELVKVDSETKKTVLKLTPAQLYELTASPGLVPVSPPATGQKEVRSQVSSPHLSTHEKFETLDQPHDPLSNGYRVPQSFRSGHSRQRSGSDLGSPSPQQDVSMRASSGATRPSERTVHDRPSASRAFSTPTMRKPQPSQKPSITPDRLKTDIKLETTMPTPRLSNPPRPRTKVKAEDDEPLSLIPISMPLPPLSIPAFLQLEMSSHKPSPLYIYRSSTNDAPYEDSAIKIERLLNFLLLPPQLELILWFGALACLDSWLYTFTILPLRFIKAFWILVLSWVRNLVTEICFFASFIYAGVGRMWRRRTVNPEIKVEEFELRDSDTESEATAVEKPVLSPDFRFPPLSSKTVNEPDSVEQRLHRTHGASKRHKRARSAPSSLLQDHKADLLKGLLIIISCALLLQLDASMMYHSIRGQAAIKLYVIYNVLEVSVTFNYCVAGLT